MARKRCTLLEKNDRSRARGPAAPGIPGAIAATPHRRSLAYGPRSPRGTGYEEGRAPAAVPSTRV